MPPVIQSQNNQFISSDSLIVNYARQRVIEQNNGQLVTPVFTTTNQANTQPARQNAPSTDSNSQHTHFSHNR